MSIHRQKMLKTVVTSSSLLAWPLVWPCVCLAQESRPSYSLVEDVQAQSVNSSSLKPSANFQPVWVWSKDANDTPLTMTQKFYLDAVPSRAELQVATDNSYTAFVNGQEFGKGRDWTRPEKYDISAELVKGVNQLRLECVNEGGEAGAIAAIRLQYGSQVLVVGTSKSVVTMNSDGTVVPTATKPANSSPWNLHKLESAKTGFVRAEANRLLSDLGSMDIDIAAKALGYLAYLSLEFPNLDLFEPTFSLVENSAVVPVPATDPLVARVRFEVVSRLDAPNPLVRGGAIAALTLLVSKSKDSKNLLEFITPSYCKVCGTNIDLQLALLSGLNQRIASDSTSFAKMVADARKASEAKKAELDQAQGAVDAKEIEIAKAQNEVIAVQLKQEQIELQTAQATEEKETLEKRLAVLTAMDAIDPIRIRDEPIVVAKLKKARELIDVLKNRDGELLKSLTSSKNKARRLTEDLDDMNITLLKLKKELDSLATPVASVDLFKRLDDIELFLKENSTCHTLPITRSLALSIVDASRRLRYSYYSIQSFTNANMFFASGASGNAVPNPDIGASTSAADRPTVGEWFTSGDRAGVSITAPYDANVRPQSWSPYPTSDDGARRIPWDTSKNANNEFRKAPGGSGGVKPK